MTSNLLRDDNELAKMAIDSIYETLSTRAACPNTMDIITDIIRDYHKNIEQLAEVKSLLNQMRGDTDEH